MYMRVWCMLRVLMVRFHQQASACCVKLGAQRHGVAGGGTRGRGGGGRARALECARRGGARSPPPPPPALPPPLPLCTHRLDWRQVCSRYASLVIQQFVFISMSSSSLPTYLVHKRSLYIVSWIQKTGGYNALSIQVSYYSIVH